MSDEMKLVYNAAIVGNSGGWLGYPAIWVDPQLNAGSPIYHSPKAEGSKNWALVLDRRDPKQAPLFEGNLSSNTDVPDTLRSLMTPDHIMLFMSAGLNDVIPQGDLFKMLQENGAGAELTKVERFAYFRGCGMVSPYLYKLVCVPGSNLPGIEHSMKCTYAFAAPRGLDSLISLIPGADGYSPIEIG